MKKIFTLVICFIFSLNNICLTLLLALSLLFCCPNTKENQSSILSKQLLAPKNNFSNQQLIRLIKFYNSQTKQKNLSLVKALEIIKEREEKNLAEIESFFEANKIKFSEKYKSYKWYRTETLLFGLDSHKIVILQDQAVYTYKLNDLENKKVVKPINLKVLIEEIFSEKNKQVDSFTSLFSTLFSPKRIEYLKLVRKKANPKGDKKVALYIGSGGDISTILAATDAKLFIFADEIKFEPDNENLADKAAYFADKEKGWSESEVLHDNVQSLKQPILWELEKMNASVGKIKFRRRLGAYEIPFLLPGEKKTRKILFFEIGNAYDHNSYSKTFLKKLKKGIDFYFIKAFPVRVHLLPDNLKNIIIKSLSTAGLVIADGYQQDSLLSLNKLKKIPTKRIADFEKEHNITLGYAYNDYGGIVFCKKTLPKEQVVDPASIIFSKLTFNELKDKVEKGTLRLSFTKDKFNIFFTAKGKGRKIPIIELPLNRQQSEQNVDSLIHQYTIQLAT
ncbi:hypothetical protein ACFLQ1_02470 [Candidatus Auribacterota bacterium]